MRIAVMGIGSLGTIVGALLAKGGVQADLIDASREIVDALNRDGATVTGSMELNMPVKACCPDEATGMYDMVILLTKQLYNEAALGQIMPHLHANSVVCTLQNGIPEDSVAMIVGKERTMGGSVGFGATWIKPGVSALTSPAESLKKFAFDIGEIDGVMRPRLHEIKKVLENVGGTEIILNLMQVRWTKVLANATFSGMSASLGCSFGDVLNNPQAMVCIAHLADETIKVAHSAGIRLTKLLGEDMEFLELKDEADVANKMAFYHKVWGPHAKLKASMLQDLEKGKRTEIDYINGVVSKRGREKGVPTPYNDKVVELVKEAEAKGMVPDFATNLKRFEVLFR
ncbi:MAG TPA: 2-dehydropantoate 2-reductase [Negativicutes bacterium]|nr:2-dehydropantoate 2-reductase [Negativicutes bacterium]